MCDDPSEDSWLKVKAWLKSIPWEGWTAFGTLLTALIALGTVIESTSDSKASRDATATRYQGVVMISCEQEYFGIRQDAANKWNPPPKDEVMRLTVKDLYSERMYGLHFEEYHLFRQNQIATHIYADWIKSFKHGLTNNDNPHYPPLDIKKYIDKDPKEDFNIFLTKVLQSDSESNTDVIISNEARMPPYPIW